MIKAESKTVINRPIDQVYQYVATNFFENHPKWESTVLHLEKTSPETVGLGTTGKQVRNDGGRRAESTFHVTEYDCDRRFAITSTGKPYFKNSYVFEPTDDGTQLTYQFELKLEGLGKLLEPLIAGSAQQGSQNVVDNLKHLLEASRG
ncbi:SRPBCC family protein [Almyronema epifaneia]|uniref:SRPBCC family protein n=1 Tax=Almyronema epifaneia S1 TaxID=2991925 RepID=A0ABW6IEM9_9CYAN